MSKPTEKKAEETQTIFLPVRRVPVPPTISTQARAFLRNGAATPRIDGLPAASELAAWRPLLASLELKVLAQQRVVAARIALPGTRTEWSSVGLVPTCVSMPPASDLANDRDIVMFLHGGGLVLGGGECVAPSTEIMATASRRRTIGVDFRCPPGHPYPAALEDCIAVYRALIETHDPRRIVIAGRSGGGNLAVALLQRVLPLGMKPPAALALFTPELDLSESGDSFATMLGLDVVLNASLVPFSRLYAGGRDLVDPELSPLFGTLPIGFPPTFLQSGTRDLFLSNTVLMHRKLRRANVAAELHLWEAMPHGGFGGESPEDAEVSEEYRHFLAKNLGDIA